MITSSTTNIPALKSHFIGYLPCRIERCSSLSAFSGMVGPDFEPLLVEVAVALGPALLEHTPPAKVAKNRNTAMSLNSILSVSIREPVIL